MRVRTTRSDSIGLPVISRYDLLLALLPVPLLCGAFASVLTSIPEATAMAMGTASLPSALVFVYAITAAAPTTIERSA